MEYVHTSAGAGRPLSAICRALGYTLEGGGLGSQVARIFGFHQRRFAVCVGSVYYTTVVVLCISVTLSKPNCQFRNMTP